MGLPSNIPPPPANLFGPTVSDPTPITTPSPNPFMEAAPNTAPHPNPFEAASTMPHLNPFEQPAPATIRMSNSPSQAPSTDGGIDIVIAAPAPVAPSFIPQPPMHDVMMLTADDTHEETAAPSRQDLLQRAADLGPRRSFDSIVLSPTDPILLEKVQPRVAERRARFRKVVKVALGACVALCLVGTAATALGTSSASTSHSNGSGKATASKTAPAAAVVPVEKLELTPLTKAAPQHAVVTAAARPTPALKKRR